MILFLRIRVLPTEVINRVPGSYDPRFCSRNDSDREQNLQACTFGPSSMGINTHMDLRYCTGKCSGRVISPALFNKCHSPYYIFKKLRPPLETRLIKDYDYIHIDTYRVHFIAINRARGKVTRCR